MSRPRIEAPGRRTLYAMCQAATQGTDLEPRLVLAVVLQESMGYVEATRYEDHWIYFTSKRGKPLYDRDDWVRFKAREDRETGWRELLREDALRELGPLEFHHQSSSWGLMQVMGSVAREYGLRDPNPWICAIPSLCLPLTGLWYGIRHFRRFWERYDTNREQVLAAYNAGGVRRDSEGHLVNQDYVDKVMARYDGLSDVV